MKLPETICIGYQDVEVIETDFPDGELGCYISEKSQMRFQKGLESREYLNTLLHECLHAIIYSYGFKSRFKDDDDEEKFVTVIGNGLAEIFSRNPDLSKWVTHHASR